MFKFLLVVTILFSLVQSQVSDTAAIDSASNEQIINNCDRSLEELMIKEKISAIQQYKIKADSIITVTTGYTGSDCIAQAKSYKNLYKIKMDSLRLRYPISIETVDNTRSIKRSQSIFKGLGVLQLLSGAAGFAFTIADANKKTNFMVGKEKITIKNEWSAIHTAAIILSSTIFLGGIIVISI